MFAVVSEIYNIYNIKYITLYLFDGDGKMLPFGLNISCNKWYYSIIKQNNRCITDINMYNGNLNNIYVYTNIFKTELFTCLQNK